MDLQERLLQRTEVAELQARILQEFDQKIDQQQLSTEVCACLECCVVFLSVVFLYARVYVYVYVSALVHIL